MTKTKLRYTFKSDVLFKMLFAKHPNLLKRLVAVLLNIPLETIQSFETINTEMTPEEIGKKYCRLDILMVVNDQKVNIEIQVKDKGNHPERSMFHWAKMYTSSLPAGDDYSALPKCIVISIRGYNQFTSEAVHSEFAPMETTRHEILSDKQRYHFFELPKLPNLENLNTISEKDLWLALFKAETEEDLAVLTQTGGEVMTEAIQAYRGITATEKFKYMEILREGALHDEAQALNHARKQGMAEGITNMLEKMAEFAKKGLTLEEAMELMQQQ